MRRATRLASLLILVTLVVSALVPRVIAAPVQATQPDVRARAEVLVDQLAAGRFEDAAGMFDEKMRAALPVDKLRLAWVATEQAAGAFERRVSVRTDARNGFDIAIVTCTFARNGVDVQIAFNGRGEVAGLSFRPSPPAVSHAPAGPLPYKGAFSYLDQEVTTGVDGWPLPGTLTMPAGSGPFPAVVLVHGSGPQDRDATLGPNKVFRDLAAGLASHGIAVLRYTKRTQQHAGRAMALTNLTVKEEAIEDALAAVALLRRTAGIDAARVFVLGHSMGGMLAPRIAAEDSALAGLIVLAGATKSLEQAIVEQTRYLAMADGDLSDADRDQLMQVERLAATVRALTPGDAGKAESIGGAPASYWLDLRGYDPPALASRLPHPFLVLQGERDYQVTMADFARWRAALESRANVTLRSYPALNHIFMAGSGLSLPAEYLVPGHVDVQVVDDIARWITDVARRP